MSLYCLPLTNDHAKDEYALKARLVLADEAATGHVESLRSDDPKHFLEHVLIEARNAGVIASIRGQSGGQILVKKPAEVSVSELLRTIEGPVAPLPCLTHRANQRCEACADEASCRVRSVFAAVFWSYLAMIESLILRDMLQLGVVAEQVMGSSASA